MNLLPVSIADAKVWVTNLHRHHRPPPSALFALAAEKEGVVVGVVIVGRPVARGNDDGHTAEVTRCATDGTRNACSFLYGAAWRAARTLGYKRMFTYTLPAEGGASLRACGWLDTGPAGGGAWCSRGGEVKRGRGSRKNDHPLATKTRWVVVASDYEKAKSSGVSTRGVKPQESLQMSIFEEAT